MKSKIIFLFIIMLAGILRLFHLGTVPPGLYSDETAFGYNAYSILQTGKDEYGVRFPIILKSFGDYKAALYTYYLIPFVSFLGLNEFAVRSASAVLGIVIIILSYLITCDLFKKRKVALLTSLILSISPLMIQFQRFQHENNLSFVLILLGIYLFLKFRSNSIFIIFSVLSFSLSIYAYHDAKILSPVIFCFLCFIFFKIIIQNIKIFIVSVLIGTLVLIPYLKSLQSTDTLSRPKNVVVFSEAGVISDINLSRNDSKLAKGELSSIFYNKITFYAIKLFSNYLSHFSPDFLFNRGDAVKIYSTPNNGILYWYEAVTILIGLFSLSAFSNKKKNIIFLLLFISPFAPALTRFVPSASRLLFISFPFAVLSGVGIITIWKHIYARYRFFIPIILLIFLYFSASFLYSYFMIMPVRYAKEWHYGMKDVINYVSENQNKYQTIWFSKHAWGYIYTLFYLKFPPNVYQQKDHLGPLNEYGFGWVGSFDKYRFDDFPMNMSNSHSTLFIGDQEEFSPSIRPLKTIYYPDKSIAFYIADQNSFRP